MTKLLRLSVLTLLRSVMPALAQDADDRIPLVNAS